MDLLWELPLHPTDILLENLSVSYLLLHLSCLPRVSSEHQQAWCESVQAVDCSQVLQVVFLSQYEDHSVKAVSSTRVHLITNITSDTRCRHHNSALTLHHPASACLCHVGRALLVVWAIRGNNITLPALLWAFKEGLAFSNDYKHSNM